MRHSEQVRLMKQLCAHLDAGTNVDAGGLRQLDPSVYTDQPGLSESETSSFYQPLNALACPVTCLRPARF